MKHKDEESQHELLSRLFRIAGPRSPVPQDVRMRVKSAVHTRWKQSVQRQRRARFLFLIPATAAASLALYTVCWQVFVGSIPAQVPVGFVEAVKGNVVMGGESSDTSGLPVHRGQTLLSGSHLESSSSGQTLLRLLNGITVRIDVASRVSLHSESSLALDRGAVYLDCGKAGNSVKLTTDLGTITDQGTQFEVRLSNRGMRVAVREGSVSFEQRGISRKVDAGRQLIIDPKGSVTYGNVVTYGPHWNWISEITPPLRIENRSLMEFLEWITRENGWGLTFQESRIRNAAPNIVLHGSIAGLKPEEMPDAVLPVCGLAYTLERGILTVKPRER